MKHNPAPSDDTHPSVMVEMLVAQEAAEEELKRRNKVRWGWIGPLLSLPQAIYMLQQSDPSSEKRYLWYALIALLLILGPYWAYRHYKDIKDVSKKFIDTAEQHIQGGGEMHG